LIEQSQEQVLAVDLGVAPPGGQVAGVGDRFLGFDC
jgi:hypothetical protein